MRGCLLGLLLATAAALALPAEAADTGPAIALSFDDGLDPRSNAHAAEWNEQILAALASAKVQSILFAAGRNVDSPEGLDLVRAWGSAGHEIGNHSYSHANLGAHATQLSDFIADVARNDALLRTLPGWVPRFRFPYLKEGDTAEKRDGFRAWLQRHHYRSGEVSIDTSDWYYSSRFTRWHQRHSNADIAEFRALYLAHLWDRAQYYDGLAQKVLKRHAQYVILLHTNAINAVFLPDIIAMFRSKGWPIVSPEQAYTDPLYRMQPTGLPAGESILWSLARQQGIKGLRYPGEDSVYEEGKLAAFAD